MESASGGPAGGAPSRAPGAPRAGGAWRGLTAAIGQVRLAYLPVLAVYFAYGASTITAVALVFFQKDVLRITPAEVAEIAFWVNLPWSMKMVAGAASDAYPLLGSRRVSYLLLGVTSSALGYLALATVVDAKAAYLVAMLCVTAGFMVQDVIADALTVEVVERDDEIPQVQALGRMALLGGTVAVGYLGGVLAGRLGPRGVMAVAVALPALVAFASAFVRERKVPAARPHARAAVSLTSLRLVLGGGLAYAALGVALGLLAVPGRQEIVLVLSATLLALLLRRVGITREVAIAACVIFLFRAIPTVGQGYTYWAIDRLGFDEAFLGVLAQVGAVVSLVGLIAFRERIVRAPVSATLFWVSIAAAVLHLPNIGLFYGLADRLGVSARTVAFIDTTISAPLVQLTMVPMLTLIARVAPAGGEATMFAIMASLMNLALSTSELLTRYLNQAFAVTQADYSNLGLLMIVVGCLNLVPLLALPWLRRVEGPPAGGEPAGLDRARATA